MDPARTPRPSQTISQQGGGWGHISSFPQRDGIGFGCVLSGCWVAGAERRRSRGNCAEQCQLRDAAGWTGSVPSRAKLSSTAGKRCALIWKVKIRNQDVHLVQKGQIYWWKCLSTDAGETETTETTKNLWSSFSSSAVNGSTRRRWAAACERALQMAVLWNHSAVFNDDLDSILAHLILTFWQVSAFYSSISFKPI